MATQKDSKRVRFQNFSSHEEDILISLVNKFKEIIKLKKTDAASCNQKREAWEKIHEEFCPQTGTYRTPKQLREKYENMKKKKLRASVPRVKRDIFFTIDGPCSSSESSATHNGLTTTLGAEDVAGLKNDPDEESPLAHLLENINVPELEETKHWSWHPSAMKLNKHPKFITRKRKVGDINYRASRSKAVYFENEEKRAAERHKWEKELHKKRMELLNIKIERERMQNEM